MNTIKISSLGEIKSIFNDNETNAHYFDILDKSFHGKITGIEFAKPIPQLGKGKIIWKVALDGPYLSYASLDEQKKERWNAKLQSCLQQMAQILESHPDKDFLENIIEIPGEEALFYVENGSDPDIILTEWGYIKDQHTRSHSMLKKLLPGTLKSFILKFVSGKNEPVEDINCTLTTEDFQHEAQSDTQGIVKINNLKRGGVLIIQSKEGLFAEERFEINEVEEHTIVVEKHLTLTFEVKNSKGEPVSNTPFSFSSSIHPNRIITTDEEGIIHIKHLEKLGEFKVFSPEGEELLSEPIPDKNERYELVYDLPMPEETESPEQEIPLEVGSAVEIQFLDKLRKPITGHSVHFEQEGETQNYTTNAEGIITIENLPPNQEHTLTVNYEGSDWNKTFLHPEGQQRHSFVLEEAAQPIILEFLNRRRKSLAHQPIQVYGLVGNNNFTTDSEGVVRVDELRANIDYCVFIRYKGTDWKQEFKHTREDRHQFIVKHRRFLWWWIPMLLLFFLLLSLIPMQIKHRYTVLERDTKKPISGAIVQNNRADVFKTYNTANQTDSSGKLSLDYGKSPVYKQIFGKPQANVTASKAGYRSLTAEVPLGFFKTRRSSFYLERINPPRTSLPIAQPPATPTPIQGCNSGGDGGSHSSMIQYDMGQDQGEFQLNFDLYSIPDKLNVYNCEATEIKNNTPIYSYEGADGENILVAFKGGPFITVEVISENGSSSWEYYVNCPQGE